MQRTDDNSAQAVSYLLEHSHGTCELWIKQSNPVQLHACEPLRLERIFGVGTVLPGTEIIAEAMLLERSMADHFVVFQDGRTSYQ